MKEKNITEKEIATEWMNNWSKHKHLYTSENAQCCDVKEMYLIWLTRQIEMKEHTWSERVSADE